MASVHWCDMVILPEPNARCEVYRMQSHDFGVIRFAPNQSQLASEQQNLAFVECHSNIPYPSLLLHSLNTHIPSETVRTAAMRPLFQGPKKIFRAS